jgi:methanogenic corrinoid protein MtbC1
MDTPYQQASAFIIAHRAALATAIVDYHYSLQPEFWQKFGEAGRVKSLRDEEYHLAYLAEALATADPSLFLEYLQWCKVFFTGLRFPEEAIRVTFTCMRELLHQQLPAELAPLVTAYLDAGLAHLARMPATLPSFLPDDAPLVEVSRPYLQALLRGDRAEASRLVLHAAEHGTPVKDIYLHIFQSSQLEIGRLWQTNQISVAQEHYCTAATQMIMSQLYPYLFGTEKHGRKLVVACVGEELHEIGARMVADFFELDGWDTYYLGANVPTESILRTLAERRADLLAISATITPHVHGVSALIARVRAHQDSQIKILVGGYPFNVMPTLWQQVGADGYARNAEEAVTVGNQLIETATP